MVSLKNRSKGFTIVELLIVIVVIAILATLVIVTFTGIQQRARNSQRQTDVNAVAQHLEAFYADNGYYPSLAQLQDPDFITNSLRGLPDDALTDPRTPAADITSSKTGILGTADGDHYGYEATPSTPVCDNAAAATQCTGYTITADLEGGTDTYVKKSST